MQPEFSARARARQSAAAEALSWAGRRMMRYLSACLVAWPHLTVRHADRSQGGLRTERHEQVGRLRGLATRRCHACRSRPYPNTPSSPVRGSKFVCPSGSLADTHGAETCVWSNSRHQSRSDTARSALAHAETLDPVNSPIPRGLEGLPSTAAPTRRKMPHLGSLIRMLWHPCGWDSV